MKTKIASMLVLFLVMTSAQAQMDPIIWNDGHHVFSEGYAGDIYMYNDATADIIGGSIGEIRMYDSTLADISGGDISILWGQNESEVVVRNGSDIGLLRPNDFSLANVYGGEINHLFCLSSSETRIFGGNIINGIDPDDSSIVYLYAEENYEFDPAGGTREGGIITGKWLMSGDSFSISLDDFGDINHIEVIPEPCSFVLLTIGWFVSRKRKSIR